MFHMNHYYDQVFVLIRSFFDSEEVFLNFPSCDVWQNLDTY